MILLGGLPTSAGDVTRLWFAERTETRALRRGWGALAIAHTRTTSFMRGLRVRANMQRHDWSCRLAAFVASHDGERKSAR